MSSLRRRPRRIPRVRRVSQVPDLLRAAGPALPDRVRDGIAGLGPSVVPVLWELIENADTSGMLSNRAETEDPEQFAALAPDVRAAMHATSLLALLRPADGAPRILDRMVLLGGQSPLALPLRNALTPYGLDATEAIFDALHGTDDLDLQMLLSSVLSAAGLKDARLRSFLRNEVLPRNADAFIDAVRYTGDPALLPDLLALLQDAEAHPQQIGRSTWETLFGAIIACGGQPSNDLLQRIVSLHMSAG